MPGWTRASELDRTLNCVGSKLIPSSRLVSEGVKKAGAWGTFCHYWKETGELLKTSEFYDSFKKTFDKKWENVGSPELRENLWPSTGQHEVAYAYSCDTGEVIRFDGTGKDAWKSGFGSEWICGTLDYEGERDGYLWVDDLKTGGQFDTPPDRIYQLYFYAMCASISKFGRIRGTVVSITHWPKYTLTVAPVQKFGFLPRKRVLKFQKLVQFRYEEWKMGYSLDSFNPGSHCTYCPAGNSCPVQ